MRIGVPDSAITMGDDILSNSGEMIVGIHEDKQMVADVDAGVEVDLDAYSHPELGHMVFFFDYRTKYHMVDLDMWNALFAALPEACPACGSTKIRITGKTLYQTFFEFSNSPGAVQSSWICYDEHCGAGFQYELSKEDIQ